MDKILSELPQDFGEAPRESLVKTFSLFPVHTFLLYLPAIQARFVAGEV